MGVAASALFTLLLALAGAGLVLLLERLIPPREGATLIGGPLPASLPALPAADRWMRPAAPWVALLGTLLMTAVLPLSPRLVGADLTTGAFYFIVVVDFVVLGAALGGWGANARGAVDSFYRVTAQLVSYVVPLGLAYVGAVMMAQSLSTVSIVQAQRGTWFVVTQPLGFALYLVTALMQSYRPPFSEPFSPRLWGGVLGVSGGPAAWAWRLTLAALLFAVSAMGVVLFLGGWNGPLLPAPLWMLVKTLLFAALLLGLGRLIPPQSTAVMLRLSWRVLTPLGLLNVLIVGGLILLGVGPR